MPRSKTGAKRKPISKEDIEKAIEMVLKKERTVYSAAKETGIDKTTLLRHLKAFKMSGLTHYEYKQNNDKKKVFTVEEEDFLLKYILDASNLHYGLTLKGLRELAYQFAKENNKSYDPSWDTNRMAGKEWLRNFRKRYSRQLSLRKPEATSLARSTSFNKTTVAHFFQNYKKALNTNPSISPFNIWNCDETGISTVHVPPKILASKGLKQVGSMTNAERGTNVTMIAAVNAGGGFMPPMLIFPRKNFKDYMLKGAPIGTIGGANPSGWSNEDLFYDFMQHFIKFSYASKTNPVILLMDNHKSHISVKSIKLAKENGVTMVTFHPHTSHKMQPLDRGVYGPFKAYYNTAMNDWMGTAGNVGKPATIYDVAGLVGRAFPLAFTQNNIISGFKCTGIHPLNENIFPDSEFMSSNVTDRPPPSNESEQLSNTVGRPLASPNSGPSTVTNPSTCENSTLGSGLSPSVIETPMDINEPSTSSSHPTGSTPFNSPNHLSKVVSPEDIRPFPKALPRKDTRKGRPKGKSLILTDTPEKDRIEKEKATKEKKLALKKKGKPAKSKLSKKVLFGSSDSEPEDITDLYEEGGFSEEDFADLKDPDDLKIEVGNYVLVKLSTKKHVKYFVAEIMLINEETYEVSYLKQDQKVTNKFTKEDLTIYEIQKDEVVFKLPQPMNFGGSERQMKKVTFSVDLASYNVG